MAKHPKGMPPSGSVSSAAFRPLLGSRLLALALVAVLGVAAAAGSAQAQDLGSVGGGTKKNPGKSSGNPSGSSKKRKPTKRTGRSPATGSSAGTARAKRKLACATQQFESEPERRASFEKALAEGKNLRAARDYQRAESLFLDAVRYQCDVRAFLELGSLYRDELRWSLAEEAFSDALQMEPNNVEAMVALSNTLTRPFFMSEIVGRYSEAERLARRAVFLGPTSAAANQQLGEALETLGLISRETQAYYEQATRLNPKSASAFAHLSRVLRKNGRMRESAKALTTAIGLAKDIESRLDVAEVLHSLQQSAEAEEVLKEVLKEDPVNPSGLQLLGQVLVRQQKNEDAEAVLKKAAAGGLRSVVPFIALGSFYLRQQKLDDAEGSLLAALPLARPSEKSAVARKFEELGEAFVRTGRAADATRAFRTAKTLDPKSKGGRTA